MRIHGNDVYITCALISLLTFPSTTVERVISSFSKLYCEPERWRDRTQYKEEESLTHWKRFFSQIGWD
ncbi:hypothetical protein Y032_0173g414 [Ancylostoma ceylanicum]|uniref:Uncharacterized protein n=1 Tax=Ancylostoma ceylanicum TaxID=53326 RepID=A0A016SV73_9BILA|nr:hypothetical protein Y032_0173g414 [Ancylostoma ceylanicum]